MMFGHFFRQAYVALAAAVALATCASAFAFTPPPFPRLAGVDNGGPFNYNDPTYQSELAKENLLILAYWNGFTAGNESMQSIVQSIKAANPNELIFLYVQSNYQNPNGAPDAWTDYRNQLNAMKWWLYPDTTFSSPVPTPDGWYVINNTPYTPKDSSGDDSIDYITKWFVSNFFSAVPNIDGFFMDNVFVQPNVAGDWYRDNTLLQPTDPRAMAAIQAGYERYFSLVRTLMPGKYQIGNVTEWSQNNGPVPSGYVNMANGGLLEGSLGASWSIESWAGWQAMMNQYNAVMASMSSPQLVIFNQYGSPTDYQSFRYGFASCLLNNGYYSFTNPSVGYSGVVWFDEFNASLGQAVSPPPTAAWQKGVWRRDFTNGIALVNPKGNGAQTVQLGGTFVKINGTQDPAVNSGQTVTSVTLQDRDGLILLRQSPVQQPKAPTAVSATG